MNGGQVVARFLCKVVTVTILLVFNYRLLHYTQTCFYALLTKPMKTSLINRAILLACVLAASCRAI